jgi:hypothetical protein
MDKVGSYSETAGSTPFLAKWLVSALTLLRDSGKQGAVIGMPASSKQPLTFLQIS